jgi:membrane protease YdiL (CAAX protease family)
LTSSTRPLFAWAVAAELSLLALAGLLNWLWPWNPLGVLRWNTKDALLGLAAVGPLLAGFGWTLRSAWKPLVQMRTFLDTTGRQLLGRWSLGQLTAIACLAGVCEEALFRGAIQGGLSGTTGSAAALLLASALFGLCHAVNPAYALAATLLGIWLGGLFVLTGNLLAPMVTHAVYDFAALLWLVRWHWPLAPTQSG